MSVKSACPVCRSQSSHALLDHRPKVPVLQNTTLENAADAKAYPTGNLTMLRCETCSFVWNSTFDPDINLYDQSYNNDVSNSDYYRRHLEDMADRILASIPPGEDIHYVEVGCGDGEFMRLLMERAGDRCKSAIGFDPAFTNDDQLPEQAIVHKHFFTPDQLDLISTNTNVVCSRHTIEHVADAHQFAETLASLINDESVRLFVETPDANWILENAAFQDFFYEHCSIYTPASISRLMSDYGLSSIVVPVYDGQYMWLEARKGGEAETKVPEINLAERYLTERKNLENHWAGYLSERSKEGPVAIWGAASKGVTFSLLFQSDNQANIDCAIDLNQQKQNRFLPITAIKVVDMQTAIDRGVKTVIIMNPNYEDEIRSAAHSAGWSPEFATLNG